jgi:tetratricopeptide (TPR) repeat protein
MPRETRAILEPGGVNWRLDAQIARLTYEVDQERDSASRHLALSALLYRSAQYSEERDKLEWSVQESTECLRLDPVAHACALMRGRAQLALARLDAASADVARAKELGASAEESSLLTAEVDWAQGRYADAIHVIRSLAEQQPTPENLVRRARLEHELGHYPFAEHMLVRAIDELHGTDQVQQAWIEALRGAHNRKLGRLASATLLLRHALQLAPGLPAALLELGRTLQARGDLREATQVYRRLVASTMDPEFIGELASLHRARKQHAVAADLDRQAQRLFDEGLMRYPDALRLPAVRFYLAEERDVGRALHLLHLGSGFRSSAELELTARANLAAGRLVDAEEAIHAALALAPVSLQVLQTAQLTYRTLAELSP